MASQSSKNTRSKEPSSDGAERTPLRASEASSCTQPPTLRQTQPAFGHLASSSSGASSSSPLTLRKGIFICPICKRDLCHLSAFRGHLRWYSDEKRSEFRNDIQRVLASRSEVQETVQVPKKKLLDLNELPDDDDDA
ncbi:hypothetical protein Tco_0548524 [Tanacetum coccineum]